MSRDRFIHFPPNAFPEYWRVRRLLDTFLGELACGSSNMTSNRYCVRLHGACTNPDRVRFGGVAHPVASTERWIEVFYSKTGGDLDHIDVITRQQDQVTNVIADGFAEMLARMYGAKVEY